MRAKKQRIQNLTPQQAAFAYAYVVRGSCGAAYKEAYADAKGKTHYQMQSKGEEIARKQQVQDEIARLRAQAKLAMGHYPIEVYVQQLRDIAEEARQTGKLAVARAAIKDVGTAMGYNIERSLHVNVTMDATQARAQFRQMMATSPQVVADLMGIPVAVIQKYAEQDMAPALPPGSPEVREVVDSVAVSVPAESAQSE